MKGRRYGSVNYGKYTLGLSAVDSLINCCPGCPQSLPCPFGQANIRQPVGSNKGFNRILTGHFCIVELGNGKEKLCTDLVN